jgi:hypothetical protein
MTVVTDPTGQLVTVGAHDVIVLTLVVKTVEVVIWAVDPVADTVAFPVKDGVPVTTDEVPVTVAEELAGDVWVVSVDVDVAEGQIHPLAAKLVIGGTVQVAKPLHETIEVVAGASAKTTALTSTGKTAPVAKLKVRCPRTRSMLAVSPEWLVTLMNLLESDAKTASSAYLERMSWAAEVSASTPLQSSSFSVKPASNL